MNKKLRSWQDTQKFVGLGFVSPFIIGAIFFIIIPIIRSFAYSFCDLTITNTGYNLNFVGLEHYKWLLFTDPNYRLSLVNSLKDMLVNVPITIFFSFFIASLLNREFRGRGAVRGILFLPLILASGIYVQLANVDSVSNMSGGVGGEASAFAAFLAEMELANGVVDFLVSSAARLPQIIAMSAVPIVIFLAAFQTISPAIFESAYMEGATKWETFWKISFPMVSPMILVCVIYSLVDSFTSTSNSMINGIHNTIFTRFNFGVGNAMVWIYLLVIYAVLAIIYAIINRFIFYYE